MNKFAALSGEMRRRIETGKLRYGEKLPSVRLTARGRRLSMTTVLAAYRELEASDLIEARPRSGYYVKFAASPSPGPGSRLSRAPMQLEKYRDLMPDLLAEADQGKRILRLGVASIEGSLLPRESLARVARLILRSTGPQAFEYADPMGLPSLRKRIGTLMMDHGVSVAASDAIVTSGCQEALWIALQSVCKAGDALAMQSPCYPGAIKIMQLMGLKAVEIPSTPSGLDLEALEGALRKHRIAACYVMPNCANPTGSVYSEETKQQLCELAARHDLPLIEDSANGDLYYGATPVPSLKSYDQSDRVLFCSSFSKTVAPAFRVGWILPGRFAKKAMELKYAVSLGTPLLQQMVIDRFISEGSFKRGLLQARRVLATTIGQMLRCVEACFPPGTVSHRPLGGMCAWIGLPPGVDGDHLRLMALEKSISLAPGRMFSPSGAYANYIRLGWGGVWTKRAEAGVRAVGAVAHEILRGTRALSTT